jgi:catechol 2,3-dioxygenase-like lactoylglutathione lyase family enzyme
VPDLVFESVTYAASDPDHTRRWLRETLDTADGDGIELQTARSGAAYTTANNDVGAFHVCLRTADIAAADARLRALGVAPSSRPTRSDVGPILLYFRDPDGIQYQLIELPGAPDPPTAPTLHHVAVTVGDLEASVAWLTDVLGAGTPMRSSSAGEAVSAMLQVPGAAYDVALVPVAGLLVELMAFRAPAGRIQPPSHGSIGAMHLAFTAADPARAREYLDQAPPAPAGLHLRVA